MVLLEVRYKITLSSFKIKPTEDEKGYSHKKEWFWEDTRKCHILKSLIRRFFRGSSLWSLRSCLKYDLHKLNEMESVTLSVYLVLEC